MHGFGGSAAIVDGGNGQILAARHTIAASPNAFHAGAFFRVDLNTSATQGKRASGHINGRLANGLENHLGAEVATFTGWHQFAFNLLNVIAFETDGFFALGQNFPGLQPMFYFHAFGLRQFLLIGAGLHVFGPAAIKNGDIFGAEEF